MPTDSDLTWFRYFPGQTPDDYRWSSAFALALGTSHWGGSTMSELHHIGQALSDRVGEDDAWFDEWARAGGQLQDLGDEAAAAGNQITAGDLYLRACVYYQMAERFVVPKTAASAAVFDASLNCFEHFAELNLQCDLTRVDISSDAGVLPAWYLPATSRSTSPGPAVVFSGGLDITKEIQFCMGARELARRGIACLVVDGPGTGEALRHEGITLRHDYEIAGSAAYDYLASRTDTDPNRIGIMAVSLGGYYATRCAAKDPRFAACVAWGAIWDYHATWEKRINQAYQTSLSVPGDHICWVLGVEDTDKALEVLRDFTLEGVVDDLRCPFLVVHGTEDAQVPLEDAHRLFEHAGSESKFLREFGPAEGGAQHVQIDYLPAATSYIADWLSAHLAGSPAVNGAKDK
ncbi:alpha/beta hydrolase family protein [Mycolicibacterium sp.]|uniref:alpha/beta hydrolase family protein n=1 Tax=Mycolicibacterium sp. TaxID=2320850 RepID=UPI003D0EA1C9